MPVATNTSQTVESFSLRLERFDEALQAKQPIEQIESQVLEKLDSPVRLLRWAIVKVERDEANAPFWCEGAYLKTCQ